MKKISSLDAWLQRKTPLDVFGKKNLIPDRDLGCWVSIDVAIPIHEAPYLEAKSLDKSWCDVHEYMDRALEIIDAENPLWLDRDEVEMIRDELGPPPPVACPLYFVSTGNGDDERLVYVGKTDSDRSRFIGGHAAFTKLHAPKYDGLPKHLYLGALIFYIDEDYVPIEWIAPLEKAKKLLGSIEAQLIFDLQPELNTGHKEHFNSHWPTPITFDNDSDRPTFLHGIISYGPIGEGRQPHIWT